jgi:cell division protein FtsI/penicillin-binding protein 2
MKIPKPKIDSRGARRMNWREAQRLFKRRAFAVKAAPRALALIFGALVIWSGSALISGAFHGLSTLFAAKAPSSTTRTAKPAALQSPPSLATDTITKQDLQVPLEKAHLASQSDSELDLTLKGEPVRVDTNLDPSLQSYLLEQLGNSISRTTGIVVLEPATGRVLAMVGFDKQRAGKNPCLESRFPAASVFKIVTAAAAIDTCGLKLNSTLTFNGRKYTLYKSQLKSRTNRYTNRVTFRQSFAQSINPVFGKIGSLRLGPDILGKYANAFRFNHGIDFDLPVPPSELVLTDNRYQWAEVACGFNRETTLSPLHAALIASAIVNHGLMPVPRLVDKVVDHRGDSLYKNHESLLGRCLSPGTARKIYKLMQGTVRSGTCRKPFRGYRRDRILSRLRIGGKSGTIDNRAHNARIDWFVGFAQEKGSGEAIAMGILVCHGEYLGTRAGEYARMAITHYFRNYFSALRASAKPETRG